MPIKRHQLLADDANQQSAIEFLQAQQLACVCNPQAPVVNNDYSSADFDAADFSTV